MFEDRAPDAGRFSPTDRRVVFLAALVLFVVMGMRQCIGLFILPIHQATGMTLAEISLAVAVGQLVWGAAQPLVGFWADKKGAWSVLMLGAMCVALGQICTIWADSLPVLLLTQGLLFPAGAAGGGFTILIGVVMARLGAEKRSLAGGLINAGGSLGQFALAPLTQKFIQAFSYHAGLIFLAASAILSMLPSRLLCGSGIFSVQGNSRKAEGKTADPAAPGLRVLLGQALRERSYLFLHASFFTCGFHVGMLSTHLPQEIHLHGQPPGVSAVSLALIGLCNVAGSVGVGFLGRRFRFKNLLTGLYFSRAALVALYLAAPKSAMTFYVFSALTGLVWLATVPPTAGLVSKLFGLRHMGTLYGLTLFTHQWGAFLGAFLGGLAVQHSGNLFWIWTADVALALAAALVCLPIKEKPQGAGG